MANSDVDGGTPSGLSASEDRKGFVVLPRRWAVEHTFSWLGRNRRHAKDFENLAETLAASLASPPFSWPSGGLPGRRPRTQQATGLHFTMMEVCKG